MSELLVGHLSGSDRAVISVSIGAWRGFYHDGRFATLDDVVKHYDQFFALGLSATERGDVVEYLKSL